MRVEEIMTRDPVCLSASDTARDAARSMEENDCGCLPVVDAASGRIVGMVTDRDLAVRGLAAGKGPDTPVAELMTRVVRSVPPEADVRDVERTMTDLQVRRVPIVNADGRVVGIIAQADMALAASPDGDLTDREVARVVQRVSEPTGKSEPTPRFSEILPDEPLL